LNVLAGRPGAGKSTLALAFAATVTTGGLWPDQTPFGDPEYVLFWSGEDPIDDTLIPRFIAAGGERGQIEFISAVRAGQRKRSFDPARDMALLERATSRLRGSIGAIVLDPVVAAVRSDSHKNAETRLSLQPFHDLCAAVGCAGLGIHHLTKRSEGADPIDRVSGSLAFGALPRAVLLAARDMNDETGLRRALLRGKISNGPDMGGYAYQLEVRELDEYPGIMAQRVFWGETLDGSAREILERLEGKAEVEPMDTKAGTFLRAELADGPQMAGEVIKKGEAQGLSAYALRRSFKKFGGRPQKASFGTGWIWELPKQDA
jgi:putative DNA primase/helicase